MTSRWQWADGFHAPKGVAAESVVEAVGALKAPTPENLLNAAKKKGHVLHDAFWAEGDQVWANRGRLDYARHIIGSLRSVEVRGGKEISVRAVEFVRPNGEGRWAMIDDIIADPDLRDAYLAEAQMLFDQASSKMSAVRRALKGK